MNGGNRLADQVTERQQLQDTTGSGLSLSGWLSGRETLSTSINPASSVFEVKE